MSREYIIYADESVAHGRYFSDFYGGVLIRSGDLERVQRTLSEAKQHQNFHGEVKWSKVTGQYLDKYIHLMSVFFDFIQQDIIKLRIMFTQNIHKSPHIYSNDDTSKYFLLYYQFIKHSFGLQYSYHEQDTYLRIYFDKLPDTNEANARFKAYIFSLQKNPDFRAAKIKLREDQIAEVDSHEHVILQCLDVVLGCIQFRLNDQHKIKQEGQIKRGKRTIAKEALYKYILTRIREMMPHFNIGVTTGIHELADRWNHSYRHWRFVPKNAEIDASYTPKH